MNVAVNARPFVTARTFDNLFIIGSPFIAFLFIALTCETRSESGEFLYNPRTPHWLIIGSLLLTHSHVMLVFLRSHMNGNVLRRFPYRFTVVPLILFSSMWVSPFLFGVMGFVAVYWDEWHSLMQTFGFGRIYDAKLGNNPHAGRKADMGLCFVLGLLPHLILLTCIPNDVRSEGLEVYLDLGPDVAARVGSFLHLLRLPLVFFGTGYLVFYLHHSLKLKSQGYQFPTTKLALFASTGIFSVLMATFYTVADAAYFGNIYHALQYYFIVYVSEVGVRKESVGKKVMVYCFLILGITLLLAFARSKTEGIGFFGSFWLLTSLLHFWYDGFIWSVRKQDI